MKINIDKEVINIDYLNAYVIECEQCMGMQMDMGHLRSEGL